MGCPRLFHYHRESPSVEAEGLAITWDLLPWKERDRLVAAACLAILKLEAEARLHDDFRRYVGKTNQKGSRYIQQQLATHDPG